MAKTSPIDKRLAARFGQRYIEALAIVEHIGELFTQVTEQTKAAATRAVVANVKTPLRARERVISIANSYWPRMFRVANKHMGHIAWWARDSAIDILLEEIPYQWWKKKIPTLLNENIIVFEPDDDEYTPELGKNPEDNEPIRKRKGIRVRDDASPIRGKRRPRKRPVFSPEFKKLLFEPMSEDDISRIIRADTNVMVNGGYTWAERFSQATKKMARPEQLADAITQGLLENKHPYAIGRDLAKEFDMGAAWARRIARTEGVRIANRVSEDVLEDIGDLHAGTQILAVMDERTRPHHATRHGTIYWHDPPEGEKGFDEYPQPPDEPNCRCYGVPVLTPPEEIETDPDYQANLINAEGNEIPDSESYSKWFEQQTDDKQMAVVGKTRFRAMDKIVGSAKRPQFADFIDPNTNKLMTVKSLRKESAVMRAARVELVNKQMAERAAKYKEVSTLGFAHRDPSKSPIPRGNYTRPDA